MVFIGWIVTRKDKSGAAFLMGNRTLGVGLLLGTVIATMVGTGSSMGAVAYGYNQGWGGALYGIGGGLGIALLTLFFSEIRKYNFMTMTEEVSFYYGTNKTLKTTVSLLLYLASIGWLGAHILGGSFYLSWITGFGLLTCKIITSLGFGIYVIIGGYLAVVWTDSIQSIMLFIGFILLAILSVPAAGGIDNIIASVPKENLSFLGIKNGGILPSISLSLSISVGAMTTPSFRQRLYTGRTIKVIRKSFYISAIAYLTFSIIPVIIGLSAYTINSNLENSNLAFPFMATTVLPPFWAVMILLAGLSATMSSGDSDALTGVTILLRDVWVLLTGKALHKSKVVTFSRWAIFFSMLLAFMFSILAQDILGYISKMISTLMSGMLVTVILGKYWNRSTWQGALAALISGSVTSFVIVNIPFQSKFWGNPIIPAILIAAIFHVLTSLLTPANKRSKTDILADIENERKEMDI